jgi:hypothetical protein
MIIFVTIPSLLLQSYGLSLREQQERRDGYDLRGSGRISRTTETMTITNKTNPGYYLKLGG